MLEALKDPGMLKDLNTLDRRDMLKLGLAGTLGALVPLMPSKNSYASSNFQSWKMSFRHAHTGEKFSGVYRVGDKYLPEAFDHINHVMRDFRTGDVFPLDPRVIDLVNIIHEKTGSTEPLEILSGYRSPKTNNMLRGRSSGVASKSLHMYGQAIDFRLAGYKTKEIRNIAKSLRAGGVGFYPRSNFVHVDTGRVRSW